MRPEPHFESYELIHVVSPISRTCKRNGNFHPSNFRPGAFPLFQNVQSFFFPSSPFIDWPQSLSTLFAPMKILRFFSVVSASVYFWNCADHGAAVPAYFRTVSTTGPHLRSFWYSISDNDQDCMASPRPDAHCPALRAEPRPRTIKCHAPQRVSPNGSPALLSLTAHGEGFCSGQSAGPTER